MYEWEVHCKGAIRNGVAKDEFRAISLIIRRETQSSGWLAFHSIAARTRRSTEGWV